MLSPQLLLERGMPVYEALQEPGQFILTFPYAFCASMDTGEGASAPQALRSSRPSMVGLLILLDCCACFVHQFCCLTPSCRAPQCRATLSCSRRFQLLRKRLLCTSRLAAIWGHLC